MSYPLIAPQPDSYGTVAGVAAYVGVYTDQGEFNATTVPAYDRVVVWIDQVSDMFNIALSSSGFETPITQVDAVEAIGAMVEQLVSDLAHAANSKGRFFSQKFQLSGKSMMGQVLSEVDDWVQAHAVGFTNLGIPRVTSTLGDIGSKGMDKTGEELPPLTQRKGFGNVFRDWTT